MNRRGFYQPQDAWVGDLIPYEEDGVLHLFYLHETRRTPKDGMPWLRVTTENLVDVDERGVAIASGGVDAPTSTSTPAASCGTSPVGITRSTRVRTRLARARTGSRCSS